MNPTTPIQPQQAQNMQQNASTQQQQPQNPQQFSLNLFEAQQLAVQQQQQQLNTVNHISIPPALQPLSSPSNPNSDHSHYNFYPPHPTNNANLRNNKNNNNNSNNEPPQAAVLQDFPAISCRKNGYSPPSSANDNIVNSPNSSSNSGNNKHPSFDYKLLSRRLRDQLPNKELIWSEKANQNERVFEQLDRPLVEALLLPKHRPQILQYEQRIIDFLVSEEWSYRFPANLSSFNRLLLHRLSETFKLDHHVEYVGNERSQMEKNHRGLRDDQNKAVTIYKMEKTRFANIRLSQIDVIKLTAYHVKRLTDSERDEWEEKKSKYSMSFNQHHLINNNHMNMSNNMHMNSNMHMNNNNNTNSNHNRFRYQKKLKPHNDNKNASPRDIQQQSDNTENDQSQLSVDEPQFDENEGQQQPVRMLLKKDNNNYANNSNNGNGRMERERENKYGDNKSGKKLKLENKQEKYNKMKEKIFSGASSPKHDNKKEPQCDSNNDEDHNDDNEVLDDEEVKQSLVGVIAEHEPYKEGLGGEEGQPDAVINANRAADIHIDNKPQNDLQHEVKCDVVLPAEEVAVYTDEQKEGHSTHADAANDAPAATAISADTDLKKKFGLKKGGWAITKEKRCKDINHTELFKKSKERLHALCSAGPKKTNPKILRASILQKTLEEKRRSSQTYCFFPENRYADGIDGAHTQKPAKNFNTHSLIPTANPNDCKHSTGPVVVNNATSTLHPTPPIVAQLTDATFNKLNNGVTAAKTSDFSQHDRGATPLLNTVADSQRKRNNPSHNFFKPGKTTEQIEKLLQPQPVPVAVPSSGIYSNGQIPASQLISNYNVSRNNTHLLQQLGGNVTATAGQGNVGLTAGGGSGATNTYTQLQQATITQNPYSLTSINTPQQNINQAQFYNAPQGTVMQAQYGALGVNGVVNHQVVNNNLQAAAQINTGGQPTNLYELYRQTHGGGVQQQQVAQQGNVGYNVLNGTVSNNSVQNSAAAQQLTEHNITQQQLIAQKTQCLNAIQQYNQLIHYFQNAGALNAEQQTYLLSLQQNAAIQQQHLQKIQCAEILLIQQQNRVQQQQDAAHQQAEKDKAAIQLQIDQHKNLQLQLAGAQQIAQNQAVQIAQGLQLHTSMYNQAQLSGNQNAMYVATLQMQQDQQLHQQINTKLNAILQQLIQVGHVLNALEQQKKNVTAHAAAQTAGGGAVGQPVQVQGQGQPAGNMGQNQNNLHNQQLVRHGGNANVSQANDGGNSGVVNYSFGGQQPASMQPQHPHTYGQHPQVVGAVNNNVNGSQGNDGNSPQQPPPGNVVQSQRAQIPNPTVNALILHTGNSQGNVNINIYADGQSGQNQQNNQQNQNLNNQQDGAVNNAFNSRKNKSNRNRQFLAQMPNLYKNKTPGSSQDASPTNSSENQPVADGNSNVVNVEQTPLSLTNASSNSSSNASVSPNHELADLGGVHDIAMGPRHNRQNRPAPANQNQGGNKFHNARDQDVSETPPANNNPINNPATNPKGNNQQKGSQQKGNNQQKSNQQKGNNQQTGKQQQQQNQNANPPLQQNQNAHQHPHQQHSQNNASTQNQANIRTGFQSHHSNQSNRGNNSQNSQNNMNQRGSNNQNNAAFSRGNNSQSTQNNRGNNQNQNQSQNSNQNNSNQGNSNSFNNSRGGRGHNRSASWTPDVTVWMADWFYNRDQETKNTILQLQKRLRLPNKKIKTKPNRAAPNPPDVFSNDNRNNANRYRTSSGGRRGRNYHQQRGRNNYVNNRSYNSRRDNYGNSNRFNSNSNSNNSSSSTGGDNSGNNRGINSGNNNSNSNGNNRSGFHRNRRNYRNNRNNNAGHMRHGSVNNSNQNNASNQNRNNSQNSNSNQGQHQQSQSMILPQQNIQQIQNNNNNRNSNNNLHRLQQSQQIQQQRAQQSNVTFANNLLNNNASNTVTPQTQ